MAVLESESFDGLANGATIGTGNTSFDTVTGTSLDATTDAIHGTGAMDVAVGLSTHTCRWTTSVSGRTVLHSRVYLEVVGGFDGNDAWFMGCGNVGGSVGCFVSTTSGGNLRILQSNETGEADESTLTLGLGDLARIEHVIDLDADTQSAEIYLNANVEGDTPDETITSVATMADLADWRIGRVLDRDVPFIVDEVALGDAPIGPIGDGGGPADLAVDSAVHAQSAASPALTQVHELTVMSTAHTQVVDPPSLSQIHQLAANSAVHAQTAGHPSLTLSTDLLVDSVTHAQTAEAPSLAQVHQLMPATTAHAQKPGAPGLTQVHVLDVASASHAQHADQPALILGEIITPSERTSNALPEVRTSVAVESRVSTVHAESRVSVAR